MLKLQDDRLSQQLNFLHEIDKLKTIFRRTNLISDPDRLENSAEHSWHLAFYVLILAEYSNVEIDLMHALKMILLHDIVEIDAGDTFLYDDKANINKFEKEKSAAIRLFGLLPEDQNEEFMKLWQEFEAGKTPEAQFASAVDKLQPLLHNYVTGGGSWKRHNITKNQVTTKLSSIKNGSVSIFELAKSVIDEAVNRDFLKS